VITGLAAWLSHRGWTALAETRPPLAAAV